MTDVTRILNAIEQGDATACETFSGPNDVTGFLEWDTYLGEVGSDVYLAKPGTVKHWSVCPYGAAVGLPFVHKEVMTALFEYVKMGAVHPLLGFSDSIRIEKLPEEATGPIPNWAQFAIDVGAMWMAIEVCEPNKGRVAQLYLKDKQIQAALEQLDSYQKKSAWRPKENLFLNKNPLKF